MWEEWNQHEQYTNVVIDELVATVYVSVNGFYTGRAEGWWLPEYLTVEDAKNAAQACIYTERRLSMPASEHCPICERPIEYSRDIMDGGVVLECWVKDPCPCGLYDYWYAYGNSEETIGFGVVYKSWNMELEGHLDPTRALLDEARTLYVMQDRDFTLLVKTVRSTPEDATAWGALMDRIDELGDFPLQSGACRDRFEQRTLGLSPRVDADPVPAGTPGV